MAGGLQLNPQIIQKWQEAVEAFDKGRYPEASSLFRQIQNHSAKIWFNLGIVDLVLGDLTAAKVNFNECLKRDQYLAVAYFQRGVILSLLGSLECAFADFKKADQNIRSGDLIEYRQLGMPITLTREQIQHNCAVVNQKIQLHLKSAQIFHSDLNTLPTLKCIFRPAKSLVDNVEKREFLKQAKVVSSTPEPESHGTFISYLNQDAPKSFSSPASPVNDRKLAPDRIEKLTRSYTPPPTRPPPLCPLSVLAPREELKHTTTLAQNGFQSSKKVIPISKPHIPLKGSNPPTYISHQKDDSIQRSTQEFAPEKLSHCGVRIVGSNSCSEKTSHICNCDTSFPESLRNNFSDTLGIQAVKGSVSAMVSKFNNDRIHKNCKISTQMSCQVMQTSKNQKSQALYTEEHLSDSSRGQDQPPQPFMGGNQQKCKPVRPPPPPPSKRS